MTTEQYLPVIPPSAARLQLEQLINSTDFMIIGHRGAAGLAPENTLHSFNTALAWQCPMLELDVYACADQQQQKQLVVIHDDKLNRTTNGQGRVVDHTVEQLRRLDAGDGEPIPLLQEVVDLINRHNAEHGTAVALNIELKGPQTAAPTAAALSDMGVLNVLVSSFDHRQLQQFHTLAPTCPVAPLYDRYRSSWRTTAAELNATAVNLSGRICTKERIMAMREAGYPVFVYTINTIAQARELRAAGANGVFTDRPDLLMPMLEE